MSWVEYIFDFDEKLSGYIRLFFKMCLQVSYLFCKCNFLIG